MGAAPAKPAALFDNPLGTDGFEFVEFTSPEPERLKGQDMPFDGALWGLKRGARMTRASWNARGQWVALVKRPERLRIPAVYRVGMDSFDTIAASSSRAKERMK